MNQKPRQHLPMPGLEPGDASYPLPTMSANMVLICHNLCKQTNKTAGEPYQHQTTYLLSHFLLEHAERDIKPKTQRGDPVQVREIMKSPIRTVDFDVRYSTIVPRHAMILAAQLGGIAATCMYILLGCWSSGILTLRFVRVCGLKWRFVNSCVI